MSLVLFVLCANLPLCCYTCSHYVPFCSNHHSQRRIKTVNHPLKLAHPQNIVGFND